MKIIDVVQGTRDWHLFRKNHVGASDAPVILGINPWRTKKQLWEEKVLGWDQETNLNMIRGQMMEKEALNRYQILKGLEMSPLVVEQGTIYPYISASFDGITIDRKTVVEIKCGKSSHRLAQLGKIPPYYIAQMQQQMFVAGIDQVDYFSFDGKEEILMTVKRDENFINNLIEEITDFWHSVLEWRTKYESVNAFRDKERCA